eukprot:scaffold24174_cov117-Cylindrotheca_fusiformis.AAC.3
MSKSKREAQREAPDEEDSDESIDEGTNKKKSEGDEEEVFVERTQKDVLCGRGVQVLRHIGNLRLHLAANEYRVEYMRSRRNRKKEIIESIVAKLKASGSRFLKISKTDKKKWVEADDEFAYHKVSHVLRGLRTSKAFQSTPSASSEPTTLHRSAPPRPPISTQASSNSSIEDPNALPKNNASQNTLSGISNLAGIPPTLSAMLPPSNVLQNQQNLSFLLANPQANSLPPNNPQGMPILNNNMLRNLPSSSQFQAGNNPVAASATGSASMNNDNRMLYAANLQNNLLLQAQLPQLASLLAGSQNFALNPSLTNLQQGVPNAGTGTTPQGPSMNDGSIPQASTNPPSDLDLFNQRSDNQGSGQPKEEEEGSGGRYI